MPVTNSMAMSLVTPLGPGRMRFLSLVATEEVGSLYEFEVIAEDDDVNVAPTRMLGKPASVALKVEVPRAAHTATRHFHGIVCRMGLQGVADRCGIYSLVLRPWLWLLTRRTDTRMFQHKSIQDILKLVFEPFSADYEFKLSDEYPVYDYCLQYRETDFAFVSRLLEHEGINYYFRHRDDKHTLVLVDRPQAHPACPARDAFPYRESDDSVEDIAITRWQVDHEIQSGALALTDYDFENPRTSLQVSSRASRAGASDKLEVYDYPGLYATEAAGRRYADLRLEELQAGYLRIRGATAVGALCAGHTFTLEEHPRKDQNVRHLVLSTRIEMALGGYRSGPAVGSFTCTFVATRADERHRPRRITPRPVIAGVQTAGVVGPAGEEIHTDAHGRIKVQFHWDRHGRSDADSSCWIRVAQPLAGSGWGMLALPRIGQEVVVAFLEGDPDRPMVVGRVYNGTHKPPYALPDHKTVMTLKSRSSKGGGAQDFNELRFEDKQGGEYVRLQAQSNYYQDVKKDASYLVANDESSVVRRDRSAKTDRDSSVLIGRHRLEQVEADNHLSVGRDHVLGIGANLSATIASTAAVAVGRLASLKVRGSLVAKADMDVVIDAAANIHVKAGAGIVIDAGAMLTLKAGGASIFIGPAGVSITGMLVRINSGGGTGSGSGASPGSPQSPDRPHAPAEPVDPLPST